jgi:SP family sugar:H+ symporter-like MFS transporter
MAVRATNTLYVTTVAGVAALGGFLFGSDTSMMNGAIAGFRTALSLSTAAVGFAAAVSLIGCAVGAWFAGPAAARLDRTRVMFLAGALIAIGSLAAASSTHLIVLGLSRFVVGLGIGAASAIVPGYITEISPTAIRGRLGSLWQFAIIIGQFLGLLGSYGLTFWAGSETALLPWGGSAWRWMFVAVALPASAYIVITRRLPHSPHDLIRRGREDEARALFKRIDDSQVEKQIAAIRQTQAKQKRAVRIKDLRGHRFGLQPIVWTGILLAAFLHLVGINVVKTYSNTLWQAVGFSTDQAFATSIFTVFISLIATIVAIAIIDRVGRRMLGAGAALMVLALGALAFSFSTATGAGDNVSLGRSAAITALIAMNVFALAFGVTWGPVMWVMLSELFNSNVRTTAVAVCTAVNWMTNWAVTRTFPLLAEAGLHLAYGLYTVFAALALIFVLKALPETSKRSLSCLPFEAICSVTASNPGGCIWTSGCFSSTARY